MYAHFPDVQTIAEESTAFCWSEQASLCRGLGFEMKWMMGWMHDTLDYFGKYPVHRKYAHERII